MTAENSKIIWEKKLVGRPEGTSYSQSHKGAPGDHSPLLRSDADQSLATQALIRDLPQRRLSPTGAAVVEVLADITVAAAVLGFNTFVDRGIPAIRKRIAKKREERSALASATVGSTVSEPDDAQMSPASEVAEVGAEISTREWYQLFFDAVAHGAAGRAHQALSAEAWQALASAHVSDDPETQALAAAMHELTPEQVDERVSRLLDQHPELREEGPEIMLRRLSDPDASEQPRHLEAEEPDADQAPGHNHSDCRLPRHERVAC